LRKLYDHIFNVYLTEYEEKGLTGLFKFRKSILNEIRNLNVSLFLAKSIKDKDVLSLNFEQSFKHLKKFQSILCA
jgi:hypothetical protein